MSRYFLSLLLSITSIASVLAQPTDTLQVDIVDVVIGKKKVKKTDEIRSERKEYRRERKKNSAEKTAKPMRRKVSRGKT